MLGVAATTVLATMEALGAPGAGASPKITAHHSSAPAGIAPGAAALVGHHYRHGLVPSRTLAASPTSMSSAPSGASGTSTAATGPQLEYGGGNADAPGSPGVTTGKPKVYLVLWGSQWGTQTQVSTATGSHFTYSGDPAGVAPDLQDFFAGLGTNGELWSGVMTQFCDGVSFGATSCPGPPATTGAPDVGYPLGGALAGVWEDTRHPAPASATGTQLAQEAVDAAGHFANATFASNRNAQYVVVSPTGANPDDYQTSGFCAWHDYSSDATLSGNGGVRSSAGPVAFTNLPYLPDAGAGCGQGFVNSPGLLDGVTIVGGHEYAETLTDQFPSGGWGDVNGDENADKCAWKSKGAAASRDLTLATGSFAVQTTWSNDALGGTGGCEFSHPVVSDVQVSAPTAETGVVGVPFSLQVTGSDAVAGRSLTYSAAGLPDGLTISPAGLLSGTPTTAGSTGSTTVIATDGTEVGSTTISWTVHPPCAAQLLGNAGFETGLRAPWTGSNAAVVPSSGAQPAYDGQFLALFGKAARRLRAQLSQKVAIPSWCTADTLTFWLHVDTTRTDSTSIDTLKVEAIVKAQATVLATFSNLDAATYGSGYVEVPAVDLSAYAGTKVTIRLQMAEAPATGGTNFAVDDTALATSG